MGRLRIGKRTIPLVMAIILWPGFTNADLISDGGLSDSEIRIGNIMPYTGPLAAFGAIGRAEAAYFDMVNDKGGINGRKVKFISYDDSSNPATAVEQTQKLVETDKVLLMFGSFGTPSNLATRRYLNERKIPQLFVASGDNDSGFGILAADSANRGAGVLIGARRHGAGVEDYDGSSRWTGGARKSALFELPFKGGAIGLSGAAAEVFYKESGHTLWYRTPEFLDEVAEVRQSPVFSATGSIPGKTPGVPASDGRGRWSACRTPSMWPGSQPWRSDSSVPGQEAHPPRPAACLCMPCSVWVRS